mmetsp:Transcript_21896/g.68575  ORF Transcript_21896/g.68575 Transcript_21896/m.68575 type:complete len:100 (-) Transcript_21896:70-369(-)
MPQQHPGSPGNKVLIKSANGDRGVQPTRLAAEGCGAAAQTPAGLAAPQTASVQHERLMQRRSSCLGTVTGGITRLAGSRRQHRLGSCQDLTGANTVMTT